MHLPFDAKRIKTWISAFSPSLTFLFHFFLPLSCGPSFLAFRTKAHTAIHLLYPIRPNFNSQ